MVTTKNIPDIPPTVSEIIAPAVTPGHTVILLLQNGLNIERPLLEAFPTNIILSGVSLISATELQPGKISHDDPDRLIVSPFITDPLSESSSAEMMASGGMAAAQRFVDMYNAAEAVNAVLDPDVGFVRWRKLIYNACYNSVCAIVGLDTTSLRYARHPLTDLVRPAMWEVWRTARAAGHPLPEDVVETMIDVDYWAFFKPSMLQDVEKVCIPPPGVPKKGARRPGGRVTYKADFYLTIGQFYRIREHCRRAVAGGAKVGGRDAHVDGHIWLTQDDTVEDAAEESHGGSTTGAAGRFGSVMTNRLLRTTRAYRVRWTIDSGRERWTVNIELTPSNFITCWKDDVCTTKKPLDA